MPGKTITDHQVHKYKQHRNKLSQIASTAKAGISERSARRIEIAQSLPSQRPARAWRTREDPLSAVWDSEVIPLLQTDARLNAVTLLEELQRRYPGQWDTSVLRTLQRRLRLWRAKFGVEREVYFAQEHPPGRQGISDFTVAESFFATLECELIDRRVWKTQTEARLAIFTWIEAWYNPHRRHSSLGQISPINF